MRRDGVLELQEVPENVLFCAAEGGHLGTGRRPTQNRNERDYQQLSEVMPSVLGAGIRDAVKGGEEDVHGGDELRGMSFPTQNPSRARQQGGQLSASKPTAIPLLRLIHELVHSGAILQRQFSSIQRRRLCVWKHPAWIGSNCPD